MEQRPGPALARRPLHFFIVADCSGSMASDGKIQALNNAIREALPHLADVAAENPHAEMLVRAIAFSTGAHWHVETPTPIEQLVWGDLSAGGYTDLGAALALLRHQLTPDMMEERALPPAILLVSDGMPTDDYVSELEALEAEPWGASTVRMAVGVGREYEVEVLQRFIGSHGNTPFTATNPEEVVRAIRWASVHASQVASNAIPAAKRFGPVAQEHVPASDLIW